MSIVIQPNGRLVRTNSSFVDGNRVTLQEVDVDRALDDQSFIARLRAAQTVDDCWSAIRNVPGLRVTLEREITIEFEPE